MEKLTLTLPDLKQLELRVLASKTNIIVTLPIPIMEELNKLSHKNSRSINEEIFYAIKQHLVQSYYNLTIEVSE